MTSQAEGKEAVMQRASAASACPPAAPGLTGREPAATAGRGRARSLKAELVRLRARMAQLWLGHDEIGRQYRARPREAYRLAWGWTLDEAAARFNARAARAGADPAGTATMTGSHLREYEKWPSSRRRPSVYVLSKLAATYQADVARLLDLADHEGLPQPDRLVAARR